MIRRSERNVWATADCSVPLQETRQGNCDEVSFHGHCTKGAEKPYPRLHKHQARTMNEDDAPQPESLVKLTKVNVIFVLNELHGDLRRVMFENFRALLNEKNDEAYVHQMSDYLRLIRSKYMFISVERPSS